MQTVLALVSLATRFAILIGLLWHRRYVNNLLT